MNIFCFCSVLVAPEIDDSLMDQTVSVSADLKNTTFVCSATGNPQPVIQWTRNDSNISSNKHYQIMSSTPDDCPMFTGCMTSTTLIILDTEPHDEEEYTCVANNVVGSDMNEVELTVNGMFTMCHKLYVSLMYET